MTSIVITGTVLADAQARTTAAGVSVLLLDVQATSMTGERPARVRVVKPYGTGPSAALVARSKAQRLRAGVRVVVAATGMNSMRGGVALQQVGRIDEPDLHIPNVTGEREHELA